jgi:uncharacterized protein YjlB
MLKNSSSTQSIHCPDDGTFPNNALPAVLLCNAFAGETPLNPADIERVFHTNGWVNSWRNGLYSYQHYHSTAHEALGIYSGWVKAQLGGPAGKIVTLRTGQVVILPAGVAHKNVEQSADFQVVGAYPIGQIPDMKYGKSGDRPLADKNIASVPLPLRDPVFGEEGPLIKEWQAF